MRTGSKQVSANYVQRSNGDLIGVVPEERRSWSLADADWDSRSITVETENESTNGWTISAAATEKLARLVADVANRYRFPINRDTVLGHREVNSRYGGSYPTACPGGLDLDGIVRRANQITATAGGGTTPITEEESIMLVLRNQKDAACYMVGQQRIKHLGTGKDLAAAKKVFPYRDLTDAEFRVALIGLQVPYSEAKPKADWSAKS